MTCISLIKNIEEIQELYKLMEEDGHVPIYPTHLVNNERGMIGFLSIGRIPVFTMSLHTKLASARNSYQAFKESERLMQNHGHKSAILLCTSDSPYYELLPKLGYSSLGKTTMNIKNF